MKDDHHLRIAIQETSRTEAAAGDTPVHQLHQLEENCGPSGPAGQLNPFARPRSPRLSPVWGRFYNRAVSRKTGHQDMSHPQTPRRPPVGVMCPTCGQRFQANQTPSMPFCSWRCRQIDLGKWLSEEHGVPIERESPEDDGYSPEVSDE